MQKFSYTRPADRDQALKQVASEGAAAWAGGTDLIDRMKERVTSPKLVVDLKGGALDGKIELVDGGKTLRIGALATLASVAANPLVTSHFPALARALEEAATPQIRNAGTIGGNLCQRPRCWYFRSLDFNCARRGGMGCLAQDGENRYHAIFDNELCAITHPSNAAPALLALDAMLEIVGARGEREVAIRDFFVTPDQDIEHENALAAGELVIAIKIPVPPAGVRSAYLELKEKQANDWALVSVTVVLAQDGGKVTRAAVALGHVAPTPLRLAEVEASLVGKVLDEAAAAAAGELAVDGATPLEQNAYKVQLTRVLVQRALLEAAGR